MAVGALAAVIPASADRETALRENWWNAIQSRQVEHGGARASWTLTAAVRFPCRNFKPAHERIFKGIDKDGRLTQEEMHLSSAQDQPGRCPLFAG
jgi:hypothetical protein